MERTVRKYLLEPLLARNPITVQALGICSALAVTVGLRPSLLMAAAVILTFANRFVNLRGFAHCQEMFDDYFKFYAPAREGRFVEAELIGPRRLALTIAGRWISCPTSCSMAARFGF